MKSLGTGSNPCSGILHILISGPMADGLYSGNKEYQVDIDENIDEESLTILFQMDFVKARCGDLEDRWKAYKEELASNLQASYASRLRDRMASIESEVNGLQRGLTIWMVYKVSEFHP
jgi:hypothetical protein